MIVDVVDQHILKGSKDKFARATSPALASGIGKVPQRLGLFIESLNCGVGEGRMMKMEIIADLFKIVSSGQRPPQPSQLRIIRATRASISSSSRNSPRATWSIPN